METSSDSEASIENKKIKFVRIGRRYCPHCREILSRKTYKTHRRRYFNAHRSAWQESSQYVTSSPPPTLPSPSSSPPTICMPTNTISKWFDGRESSPDLHHDILGTDMLETDWQDSSGNESPAPCIGKGLF